MKKLNNCRVVDFKDLEAEYLQYFKIFTEQLLNSKAKWKSLDGKRFNLRTK